MCTCAATDIVKECNSQIWKHKKKRERRYEWQRSPTKRRQDISLRLDGRETAVAGSNGRIEQRINRSASNSG